MNATKSCLLIVAMMAHSVTNAADPFPTTPKAVWAGFDPRGTFGYRDHEDMDRE